MLLGRSIRTSKLPPPPSSAEMLRKALNVLDVLGCTYEVGWRGTTYTRKEREVTYP